MKIYRLEPATIVLMWKKFVPLIEQAMAYTQGEESLNSLYLDFVDGRKQLWAAFEGELDTIVAIGVTQLLVHVTMKKECRIVLLSSKPHTLKKWLPDMHSLVEDWARENNCNMIVSYGRPGWGKFFDTSVKKVYTIFAKQL